MPTSDDHYKWFAAWLPDPGDSFFGVDRSRDISPLRGKSFVDYAEEVNELTEKSFEELLKMNYGPGVRRMYGDLSYADGLRDAYGPGAFVADKEEYVAPDFFCPQCNKQAAPEHVSIFCEQRTGSYGEIEVVNGHKCKCWWCQTEWEEA